MTPEPLRTCGLCGLPAYRGRCTRLYLHPPAPYLRHEETP